MVLYLIQFNRTMVREETFLRKNPLYRDNDCRAKPVTLNSGHNEILFYILLVPYFYFTLIRPGKKRTSAIQTRIGTQDIATGEAIWVTMCLCFVRQPLTKVFCWMPIAGFTVRLSVDLCSNTVGSGIGFLKKITSKSV